MYSHIKAVEALMAVNGTLPVNLKFLIEGEEEVGGARFLEDYVAATLAACAATGTAASAAVAADGSSATAGGCPAAGTGAGLRWHARRVDSTHSTIATRMTTPDQVAVKVPARDRKSVV